MEDEEHCDEEGHATRDNVGGNEEADPGDDDEHSRWKVAGDDVVGDFPPQRQLKSRNGKVSGDRDIILFFFWQFTDFYSIIQN